MHAANSRNTKSSQTITARARRHSISRGILDLGTRCRAQLRWASWPDRGDASHSGRRKALDRRNAIPARAELLHAAAGTGGARARHLHRLAVASGAGRHRRRNTVRASGPFCSHGAEPSLRRVGHIGIVQALFFGLKAAVLAIVLEAVVRVGKRALKSRGHGRYRRVRVRGNLGVWRPIPAHSFGRALVGYFGHRAGLHWFKSGAGHGPAKSETGRPSVHRFRF